MEAVTGLESDVSNDEIAPGTFCVLTISTQLLPP